ncbi:MAG: 3-dehydroquinate synthase [Acidobacteriota bacterium]
MSTERIVALTGFMGSGKTTLGGALAEHLERPFVDLDERIESHLGMTIAACFSKMGETVFREVEKELALELARGEPCIVALGGGAVMDPEIREAFESRGTLINLRCRPETLSQRLATTADDRPLLMADSGARERQLKALQAWRQPHHDAVLQQVDADGRRTDTLLTLADVIAREERTWAWCGAQARRLVVQSPAGPYSAWVGADCLASIGTLLENLGFSRGPVLVVGCEPARAHRKAVASVLESAGHAVHSHQVEDGEKHKTLATLEQLWSAAAAAGITRDRPIVAVGGGVVTDLAGLAAATFMRGVPVIHVPTTLLGMVDASLGGKTAIDIPAGKNLVGAFHHPAAVLCDVTTLETLPTAERRHGMAEVIKHGLLVGAELLTKIERGRFQLNPYDLAQAMHVKTDIIGEDPGESGRREHLNLGHTFAHAIEKTSGYQRPHGEAVAIGLVAAAHLSRQLGLCSASLPERVKTVVESQQLPTSIRGFTPDALIEAMGSDKKKRDGKLRFIVLEAPGETKVVEDVDVAQVRVALTRVLG